MVKNPNTTLKCKKKKTQDKKEKNKGKMKRITQ